MKPPPPEQHQQQQAGDGGLFVSFISKLSSSSSQPYQRWTPNFSRLVERLCSTSKVEQQVPQLQHFEETYLRHARFENTSYFAQTDLFHLWECALACALSPKLTTAKRLICLNVIHRLLERDDFSLNAQLVDNCADAKRKYNRLLVATFELATLLLKVPATTEEANFSAQALAVFLFRLPTCSNLLVRALAKKQEKEERRFSAKIDSMAGGSNASARRRSRALAMMPKFSPFKLPSTTASPAAAASSGDDAFVQSNPDLFQWNSSFVDPNTTMAVIDMLQENTPIWETHLVEKEAFFLAFVEYLVEHVTRVSRSAGVTVVRWDYVPAYDMIMQSFVVLLRSAIWWDSIVRRTPMQGMGWVTSLAGYVKVKKTAMAVLQSNPALLPFYIQTTFECTNLHNLLSVDSCIEHLQLFFTGAVVPHASATTSRLRRQQQAEGNGALNVLLPAHFDYTAFWQHFSQILAAESYQILLKSCSFLYNVLDFFWGADRTKLLNDLLQPTVFWRLFLHWSAEVRTCFHHLVVYKMLRCDRRFLPCFSDSQVMLLYGVAPASSSQRRSTARPISAQRIETSARAAWGKLLSPASAEGTATPAEIAQLTKSAQRRLAIFDTIVDDEELWADMSVSSKIDSYVRMCLHARDAEETRDGGGVPRQLLAYVEPALEQYSLLLIRYYRGATLASLDDIPASLTHRMVLTEFSEAPSPSS